MTSMSLKRQLLGLAGWLLLAFAVAALGAVASVHAASYYGSLAQPSWAPPAWLFGLVWSVLYLLMGIAAWLVWRRGGWSNAPVALALFIVQLALNALWSWLFFAWYQGALAFVDIVVLWLAIVATTAAGRRAIAAVSGVGKLCRGAVLHGVADESAGAVGDRSRQASAAGKSLST